MVGLLFVSFLTFCRVSWCEWRRRIGFGLAGTGGREGGGVPGSAVDGGEERVRGSGRGEDGVAVGVGVPSSATSATGATLPSVSSQKGGGSHMAVGRGSGADGGVRIDGSVSDRGLVWVGRDVNRAPGRLASI